MHINDTPEAQAMHEINRALNKVARAKNLSIENVMHFLARTSILIITNQAEEANPTKQISGANRVYLCSEFYRSMLKTAAADYAINEAEVVANAKPIDYVQFANELSSTIKEWYFGHSKAVTSTLFSDVTVAANILDTPEDVIQSIYAIYRMAGMQGVKFSIENGQIKLRNDPVADPF